MKSRFTKSAFALLAVCALMFQAPGMRASGENDTLSKRRGEAKQTKSGSLGGEIPEGAVTPEEFFSGGEKGRISRGALHGRVYTEYIGQPVTEPSPPPQAVKDLLSEDLDTHLDAYERLQRNRAHVARGLVENLKTLSKNPNRGLGGRFHVNVLAAGRLRIQEAVPVLLPMIDFHLDPLTFPGGIFAPMYYPVADALVEIGGQKVVTGVLEQLSQPADAERIFVSAWVLQEVLGQKAAQAAVAHAIKEIDVLGDTRHKANLSQVKQLLSMKDGLFLEGWFPSRIREIARDLLDSHEGESQKRESSSE